MVETIYLDPATYHCSRNPSENAIAFETAFFNGKCDVFVEGHYIVPSGYPLPLPNGKISQCEMIAPWKPHSELSAAQAQYEADLAAAANAYQEGVDSV